MPTSQKRSFVAQIYRLQRVAYRETPLQKPNENVSRKLEVPVLANSLNMNVSSDFNFAMALRQSCRESKREGTRAYPATEK